MKNHQYIAEEIEKEFLFEPINDYTKSRLELVIRNIEQTEMAEGKLSEEMGWARYVAQQFLNEVNQVMNPSRCPTCGHRGH